MWARKHVQALSRLQYTALKLIIVKSTKFDQLVVECCAVSRLMQLQIDIITIKFGIMRSQQQDILWKLYRKCQFTELKSDKIDDFSKVASATNCYTVSTCHEYLRSRWNRIFKKSLTTTPLEWSITQIELEDCLSKNDKQTPRKTYQQALFDLQRGIGRICVQNLESGDSALPLSSRYRISPSLLIFCPLNKQFRALKLATGNIYSLAWTTNLINFIIDSGGFKSRTGRIRHFQENTLLLKTDDFSGYD